MIDIKKTLDIKPLYLNVIIQAPSGYGKTYAVSTLSHDKTLIISAEGGLLSIRDFDIDYVELDPSNKIESLKKILAHFRESEKYENLYIDSLTEISQAFLEEAKKKFPDQRQSMPRYGLYNEMMIGFLKYTRDLGKNVFYTVLEKDERDDIGRVTHSPKVVGSIREDLNAYFDFVFCLRIFNDEEKGEFRALQTAPSDGYNCKDRSGKLDLYEKPDLQAVINKVFEN